MKKILALLPLMALLLLAFSLTAHAEDKDVVYSLHGGVRVFEEPNTSSAVLKTLERGEKHSVVRFTDNLLWAKIAIGGGQYGWVKMENMSLNHVDSTICKHEWTSWQVIEEPTCTSTGLMIRSCPICGIGDVKKVDRIPHEYSGWRVVKAPTCTSEGERVRSCVMCGREERETIPKEAHSYGEWRVTKQATCTSEGERIHTCRVCGHEERQTVDRLPHNYGEWKVTKQATCTSEGERTHTCRDCGHTAAEAVPKLPHDFEAKILVEATDHSSGIRTNVCRVCGYTEEKVSFDPEGTLRRGDRGEEVREIQQLLADQNYLNADGADGIFGGGTEMALMKFQNEQGFTPDGVAWPQTIAKLRHEFGPWEVIAQVTRDTPGERVRKCLDCGFEQHETIPLSPCFERGDRGEAVRALQQMISSIGYDPGAFDGIYGQKLDNSFTAFAATEGFPFEAGKILPSQVDALMNAWIASIPDDEWMGQGSLDSPVNLALTVTPASGEDDGSGITTYSFNLTNMGDEECIYEALLLCFGDDPDFREGNVVLNLDGEELEPAAGNSVSGSFEVSGEFGKGTPHFAALAVEEGAGNKWISNMQ